MNFLKKNYGWIIVAVLASLPLLVVNNLIVFDWHRFSISLEEGTGGEGMTTLEMLYHVTGEFAIRWMTIVLTMTPIFIIFGKTNLFVRQAMGIATAVWSLLHFIAFIALEGFLETFTQVNYIAGFVAILILVPLLLTSNRRSMKLLKTNWKKLQSLSYAAIIFSLVHIAILDKTWIIYAVIVGIGFIIRIPPIKSFFVERRMKRSIGNQ